MQAPNQVRVRTRNNIAGSNVSAPANQAQKPATSIDQGVPRFVGWYREYHGL